MRDVLHLDGHHQIRSMCHFIAFNICIGFFGYYIWLIFPRPVPNDNIRPAQHGSTNKKRKNRQGKQLDVPESDRLDDLSSSSDLPEQLTTN
ncbi:hypothetical protein COOONC_27446 [Cooperia oncophora]